MVNLMGNKIITILGSESSVVEYLTRDRGVGGSSLSGVTVLCP